MCKAELDPSSRLNIHRAREEEVIQWMLHTGRKVFRVGNYEVSLKQVTVFEGNGPPGGYATFKLRYDDAE